MLFDDRLATVLRSPVGGDAAARTQYRQLLDLLGSKGGTPDELTAERYRTLSQRADRLTPTEFYRIIEAPALLGRRPSLLAFLGWRRLEELSRRIPEDERSRILREPGQRLRNPEMVALIAGGDPRPAAAAVAVARLEEDEWLDLIPRLPVMARGFLRHRRDLPARARDLLARLGVGDMVLPQPAPQATQPAATLPAGTAPMEPEDRDGIRALLRRIEAFREGRRPPETGTPRLPLGDLADEGEAPAIARFDFTTGPDHRIDWADADIAPLVVGMRLGHAAPGTLAALEPAAADAMLRHLPLRSMALAIDAAPAISGDWRIDAEPVFAPATGQFGGYRGRLRRPLLAAPANALAEATDTPQDRMRQVLHELRTPVNAIQGFAEIIQQQIFGPAPNAYRALAAAIAVDAAKLLAAFEEVDRFTRLESAALDLVEGDGDMREVVAETIRRLDGVLRPRNAGIQLAVSGSPFITSLAREELLVFAWRVLATLASAMAPAEQITAKLTGDGSKIVLKCRLPAAIAAQEDRFASLPPQRSPALTAGMFGSGFSLRLARAEAQAAGGSLKISERNLRLTLPTLTGTGAVHSNGPASSNTTGA